MSDPTPRPDLPDLGAPLADTHAHLDMLDDPAAALEHAAAARVSFLVTIADVTEGAVRTYVELPAWEKNAAERIARLGDEGLVLPEVRVIVGAHPHNAKDFDGLAATEMRRLALDPRTCGIGEVGLDFHYDHSPREQQREMMRAHLRMAHEMGLPVCIHLREAHGEGLDILREIGLPTAGCVIHCFTEGPKIAELFLELGCHVAFGGVATFPKAEAVREALALVPLERMLLETDSPFLAPVPYRGQTNEPAFVTLTAAKVAEVKGVTPAEVAETTLANARALFGQRA